MSLLDVGGLRKSFGGLKAVANVGFSVQAGQIVGIMGANGAGKTTVFNLISGMLKPDAGSIELDGESIVRLRPDHICRRGIGRTFQIVRSFPDMDVLENVMVGVLYGARREHSVAVARRDAMAVLTEVGLAPSAHKLASQLTLAGRKRLEVARALATGPRLLMLDEVLAGLTPTEVVESLAMLRELHRRMQLTMLVIEHNMKALMGLCEKIVVLHHGEKIAEGTPAEVSSNERVVEAYLG